MAPKTRAGFLWPGFLIVLAFVTALWLCPQAIESVSADSLRSPESTHGMELEAANRETPQAIALAFQPDPIGVRLWHLMGLRGQGVKVGIVDVGFGGHVALLGSALPVAVTARTFVDGESDDSVNLGSNHGTAVAEIVHRTAPSAGLYLAKVATITDTVEAVAWLVDVAGVHVLHSSPLWYGLAPGDGTGQFAALVDDALAKGVLWVAPAGDARLLHWSGAWRDDDGDGRLNFGVTDEVNWLMLDGQYLFPPGKPIDVWLRWSDWQHVNQDLDVCLVHAGDSTFHEVACSQSPQTGLGGQAPIERLRGWTTDYPRAYGIYVRRVRGALPVHMDIFVAGVTTLAHRTHGQSLAEFADTPGALTVAAVAPQAPYAQPAYSSQGPTNGPGGVAEGGLAKPDLSAYAGVATVSRGLFEGSAAAVAHAAGAAALVRGAHPGWGPQETRALLVARSLDLGAPGWDPLYGAGRLSLGEPPLPPARLWLPCVRR